MNPEQPETARTRPSPETRDAEETEMTTGAHADRAPTEEEERAAERNELTDDVIEHEKEMAERGVNQKGEGRIS